MTERRGLEGITLKGNGVILILLSLIAMMVMFIEIMLVPALPIIAQDYSVGADWISWVLSIYLLVGAIATPLAGKLGDLYGKKRVMVITMAMYTVGLLGCGFSWSFSSLLSFRAVQGVGMGMFPLAFGIVRDTFPKKSVPVAVGIISAMFSIGVAFGLTGGGYIITEFSWRDCFYIVTPLLGIMTFLIWSLIRDSGVRCEGSVDTAGAMLLGVSIFCLLFGLTQGESWGWTDARILSFLAFSAVTAGLFVWHERRTGDPLVRLKLMADKGILESNVVAIFVGLSMFLMFQTLPFFLMSPESLGGFALASAFVVGLYMFPSAGAQLFTGPLGGVFSRRKGPDWTLSLGLGIFLLGFALLIFMHTTTLEIILAVFVSGSGLGLSMVGLINLIVNGCPQQEFGVASGMNSLFRVIGGSIGPVLGGVIMAQFTVDWIPPGAPSGMAVQLTTETGYVWAWAAGAVFACIGLILSLIIRPDSNSFSADD